MLGQRDFLEQVLSYDKDSVNHKKLAALEKVLKHTSKANTSMLQHEAQDARGYRKGTQLYLRYSYFTRTLLVRDFLVRKYKC